jgi:hypothetical protein
MTVRRAVAGQMAPGAATQNKPDHQPERRLRATFKRVGRHAEGAGEGLKVLAR